MRRRLKNRIKELRTLRNLSLEDVAEALGDGTTPSTIHKLETDAMKLTTVWIDKIAEALGVDSVEIVDDTRAGHDPVDVGDDVRPYKSDDPSKRGPRLRKDGNRLAFEVIRSRLDEVGVRTGDVLDVNASPSLLSNFVTGDILIARQKGPDARERLIVREFLEPSLLVTNSLTENALPLNTRATTIEIVGILELSHRQHSRRR